MIETFPKIHFQNALSIACDSFNKSLFFSTFKLYLAQKDRLSAFITAR